MRGILLAVAVLLSPWAMAMSARDAQTLGVLALVLAGCLYFVPSLMAAGRKNAGHIVFLNIVAGWTVAGWIACYIWAAVSPVREADKTGEELE